MGIDVNSQLTDEEECIKFLPPHNEYFDTKISSWIENRLESGVGAIAIKEMQVSSVFFNPNNSNPAIVEDYIVDMLDLSACLSVVLNSHVTLNYYWLFDKELQPFLPNNAVTSIDPVESQQEPVKLTRKHINKALEIKKNYVKLKKENMRFRVALERWTKSQHAFSRYDQYIELRIALEALFSGKGRTSSDRLCLNAARFLSDDIEEREDLYDRIRKFYNKASSIIHGEQYSTNIELEDETELEEFIGQESEVQFIQGVCQMAFMKILEAGEIPNWKTFALQKG